MKTKIRGFHFSIEQGRAAAKKGQLLTAGIETNYRCNLHCQYCAWDSGSHEEKMISLEELKKFIDSIKRLGALSVTVIGGGEPTIYPYFRELIEYIDNKGLIPVIITNGLLVDEEMAQFLYHHHCSIFIKADSFNAMIQDQLARKNGAFQKMNQALRYLTNLGFNQMDELGQVRLGISTVVTKKNVNEVPDLWRFARKNQIYPNLEILNINEGRAKLNESELAPDKKVLQQILDQLKEIDEQEFGIQRVEQKGNSCQRHLYSVYINVDGYIQPCSAVRIKEANIRETPLDEILQNEYYGPLRQSDSCILSHESQAIFDSTGQ